MAVSHHRLKNERPRGAVALVLCWCEDQFNDPAVNDRMCSLALIPPFISSFPNFPISPFPSPLFYTYTTIYPALQGACGYFVQVY